MGLWQLHKRESLSLLSSREMEASDRVGGGVGGTALSKGLVIHSLEGWCNGCREELKKKLNSEPAPGV